MDNLIKEFTMILDVIEPQWFRIISSNSKNARILEYCTKLANPIYFFYSIKGMNKTKNIHNNKNKFIVASIAIVVALALIASPIVAVDDAFATKKKKKGSNVAVQSISQSQASVQNALCASGSGTTFLSCNNVSFQNQKNTGNNALAQQDDDDGNGSNIAKQSISQSQSSSQNSQVVSGGDTIGSGNNINVQNQENSGNNAAAQS